VLDTFGRRMCEKHGEIVVVMRASHCIQLAANSSDDATCGPSLAHFAGQVTLDRFLRAPACVLGTQRTPVGRHWRNRAISRQKRRMM
jgi:hypothetical protein